MATIHSLNQSISDMGFDDAIILMKKIRFSRSVVKKPMKVEASSSSGPRVKRAKPAKPKDLINQLNDTDKLALMELLKGGSDD